MATKKLKKKNKRMNLTPWMTIAGTRKAHPDEGGPGCGTKTQRVLQEASENQSLEQL